MQPLARVLALYLLVQLAIVAAGGALGWDESIYVSQVGRQAPATWFGAPRARGVTLLAAPVAAVTSSTLALRIWLVALSGLGLYLVYRIWSRSVGARTAALAAAGFVSLWVTEYYGDQVMPNLYVALGAVAAAAFVVRGLDADGGRPLAAAGLSVAWVALVRPTDAVWLVAGLVLAAVLVAGRRALRRAVEVSAALTVGVLAGSAEWVVEAVDRFGGLTARLHEAGAQNGAGLTFSLPWFVQSVNGPLLCRPCAARPVLALGAIWWLALLGFVLVACLHAVRSRRSSVAVVPAVAGLSMAAGYVFTVPYAAPRFLLPAYALLVLPGATGATLAFRWARDRWSPRTAGAVSVALVAAFGLEQTAVLVHQVQIRRRLDHYNAQVVAALRSNGVSGRCTVAGPVTYQIVYAAGCHDDYDALESQSKNERPHSNEGDDFADAATLLAERGQLNRGFALVLPDVRGIAPPRWAAHWRRIGVAGRFTVFLPPR